MLKPHCSNFRIITAILSGVKIFHFYMVHLNYCYVIVLLKLNKLIFFNGCEVWIENSVMRVSPVMPNSE